MSSNDFTNDVKEMAKDMAMKLGEHCNSAQILIEYNEDGLTKSFKWGSGSHYARLAMAQEFINEDKARIHHYIQKSEFPDDYSA